MPVIASGENNASVTQIYTFSVSGGSWDAGDQVTVAGSGTTNVSISVEGTVVASSSVAPLVYTFPSAVPPPAPTTSFKFDVAPATTFSISCVHTEAPTISGTPPSPVDANTPYSFGFTLTGVPAPTTSLTSGSLPSGITLSSSGALSGSAITAGSYTATVTATNGVSPDATTTFTIVVTPTVTIAPDTGPSGTVVALNSAGHVPGELMVFKYKTGLAHPRGYVLCTTTVQPDGTASCFGAIPTGTVGAPGPHTALAKGKPSLIKATTIFTLT